MGTPFPTRHSDETSLTITRTVWTDSTTGDRGIYYYKIRRSVKRETKFEKTRRLESKQQKKDRVSLTTQKNNRFHFNEVKPRIKMIVTNPKLQRR